MKKPLMLLILLIGAVMAYGQMQKRPILDNVEIIIEPQKFNTISSDISPFIIGDKLYYSSVREDYFNKSGRERKNKAFYDVYQVPLDSKGHVLFPNRELVPGFGNVYHEGPVSWCQATGELFVTLSNMIDPDTIPTFFPKEHIRLRLVIKKQVEGVWEVVEELPFNEDTHHYAHPAISVTGDTLVFSSDRDSTGYGQSDLYMSIRKDGKWSDPINLGPHINTAGNEMFPTFGPDGYLYFSSDGHPGGLGQLDIYYTTFPEQGPVVNLGNKINSGHDDFGLIFHPNQETGYFTSDRTGVGSDDIYRIDLIRLLEHITGRVVDDFSNDPISGATVWLKDCSGNILHTMESGNDGGFGFEVLKGACYHAVAMKEGYDGDSRDISGIDFVELRLKRKSKYELLVLDMDDNMPLSNALIACGNQPQWFTGINGKASPEFPVEGFCNFRITKDGYLDQTLRVDATKFTPGADRVDTVWLYKKDIGRTFVLENIYYDFDKWDILPESEIEIHKLIKIMNDNPTLKVELGSHTDSRGSDSYNEWLSQKRSDSAVGYIINNGISKDRIIAKGYGEYQLVNHCANGVRCTEPEHRKNRRTEFKIIGFLEGLIQSE
jgi:outer membrane protein OmpA-like peptidoglycan-associated protein